MYFLKKRNKHLDGYIYVLDNYLHHFLKVNNRIFHLGFWQNN